MQGGTKARTAAYKAVREDAGLKFQRRRRPLSADQEEPSRLTKRSKLYKGCGHKLVSSERFRLDV